MRLAIIGAGMWVGPSEPPGRKKPLNRPLNVRFGSKADIGSDKLNVRFTSESRHRNSVVECPLCAKSGHCRVSSADRLISCLG
jgi:hypothetical protein